MWDQQDIFDIFKGALPYYLVIALPILLIISPVPAAASVEFPVFRLQQFELHGMVYGSQSSLVNFEARTLSSSSLARRCVITRIEDLTPSWYQNVVSQGASGLLVILPTPFANLSLEQQKMMWSLEEAMIDADVQMAVYFAYESAELTSVYDSIKMSTNTDSARSAAAALLGSLSSDGYQMVVGGSQSKKFTDMTIANIQGRLIGFGVEEHLPTILLVAHYDSFAAAPELAEGADSNGSGVVALLEIARIFSRLYSSSRTHPKVNVVFLLSGGGYVNYYGSKRFLEDELDASDSPLLSELQFALCLDTLANAEGLKLHVSKRPREDSAGHAFYSALEHWGEFYDTPISMVHKKINLQDDRQNWEHEKYSLRRLPAFTLSRLEGPRTGERGVMSDNFDSLQVPHLVRHINVVVAALLDNIYNGSVENILEHGVAVSEESVNAWINLLNAQPRSAQLVPGNSPFVSSLHNILLRYTVETKIVQNKADKRDPEWSFYDVSKQDMNAYAVKPASFDFFLMLVIAAYLSIVYGAMIYFPFLYNALHKISSPHQKLKGY